jgi:signal transduction histidine kinase
MASNDRLSDRSPYAVIDLDRRGRIISSVATLSFYFSIGIDALVGLLLVLDYSSQLLLAWIILLPSPFVTLLVRRWGRVGRTELAGYVFITYFMIVIGVNTTTIGGLSPILAPGLLLLIAVAGLILPPFHSFVMAAIASAVFIAGLAVLYSGAQIATIALPLAEVFVAIIIVLALLFMALISQVVTADLRKALDDATFDLVEANRKLERASEMKSQFTARTSHELRTPLSAIIAFTDLALRDSYGPLSDKLREALGHVFTSSRHLKGIINDLLDLSKIEAGQIDIVDEAFPLTKLVETVESSSAEVATEKGLKWSLYVDPRMPAALKGDVNRIGQVLVNLSGNAVKFTEKGEVALRIEPLGIDRWLAQVSDTGAGIPEDQREAIFEAYKQLGNGSANGKTRGTGLGLAITRHLVRLMGGTIRVESTLGKGSTFTVELPLRPVSASA